MIKERLAHDLKDALRAKDQLRLLTIRSVMAALTNREKETGAPVTDDDALAVLTKQAKQRRDAIAQFEAADRDDLAQRERDELVLIEQYLPAQLSDDDIRRVVQDIITRTGATTKKDLGRVMGEAMRELKGQADGNRVREATSGLLSE